MGDFGARLLALGMRMTAVGVESEREFAFAFHVEHLYCTVSTMVLLVMRVLLLVLVMVAVMFVVPAATLVANPLPLLRPLLIVATAVFDDVQVTAWVKSLLLNELP